jgi:hypothetical protein
MINPLDRIDTPFDQIIELFIMAKVIDDPLFNSRVKLLSIEVNHDVDDSWHLCVYLPWQPIESIVFKVDCTFFLYFLLGL